VTEEVGKTDYEEWIRQKNEFKKYFSFNIFERKNKELQKVTVECDKKDLGIDPSGSQLMNQGQNPEQVTPEDSSRGPNTQRGDTLSIIANFMESNANTKILVLNSNKNIQTNNDPSAIFNEKFRNVIKKNLASISVPELAPLTDVNQKKQADKLPSLRPLKSSVSRTKLTDKLPSLRPLEPSVSLKKVTKKLLKFGKQKPGVSQKKLTDMLLHEPLKPGVSQDNPTYKLVSGGLTPASAPAATAGTTDSVTTTVAVTDTRSTAAQPQITTNVFITVSYSSNSGGTSTSQAECSVKSSHTDTTSSSPSTVVESTTGNLKNVPPNGK
jgi:hypothetical protein